MKLFLERLKAIGVNLLAAIITVAIISIPVLLVELTRFIWKPLPDIIWVILLAGFLLYWIGYFINWLIIQPIRSSKAKKDGRE